MLLAGAGVLGLVGASIAVRRSGSEHGYGPALLAHGLLLGAGMVSAALLAVDLVAPAPGAAGGLNRRWICNLAVIVITAGAIVFELVRKAAQLHTVAVGGGSSWDRPARTAWATLVCVAVAVACVRLVAL